MTKTAKMERGRTVCGVASALLGILGFMVESWWISGVALAFALAWVIICMVTVNQWIEDEADRIAPRPRHRRGNR